MSPTISSVIMGCMSSRESNSPHESPENTIRAEDRKSKKQVRKKGKDRPRSGSDGKAVYLQPKISMMSDHTLKLLKEIGELKAFTEIDPSESTQSKNKHWDIADALVNPQAARSGATTVSVCVPSST